MDIRDTVNYKNVMKQYGLGPNGAILTSLNLFATRFDQVGALGRVAASAGHSGSCPGLGDGRGWLAAACMHARSAVRASC